jgi:hypothetical protein
MAFIFQQFVDRFVNREPKALVLYPAASKKLDVLCLS